MQLPPAPDPGTPSIREVRTDALTPREIRALRALLREAFGADEFDENDWEHALGGMHFLLEQAGTIVAHAAVVERELLVDGRPFRAGYVEAVATSPAAQGRGLGSRLMERVTAYVRDGFELGGLATGRNHFYERLGWVTWHGPTSVKAPAGLRPTPDDDGAVMVLPGRLSPVLDITAPIACGWRRGAPW